MKKLGALYIILLLTLTVMLFGCLPVNPNDTNSVVSLRILEESPTSFSIDEEIDVSKIKIEVTYKDGKQEIISLKESMLSENDRMLFTKVGASHAIRIRYDGRSTVYGFEITESRIEKKYNVHFRSDGGSAIESQFVSTITKITKPEKEGYTFVGWFDNVERKGERITTPLQISKDITLYAKWDDVRQWKVTFLNRDESTSETRTINHGKDIIPPATPHKKEEGWIFVGWEYVNDEGKIENIIENKIVHSLHEQVFFNVKYIKNDIEAGGILNYPVAYGGSFPESARPKYETQEGFTCRWVIEDENGEIEEITNQFDVIKKDITVIPIYEVIKFNITFQDDSQFAGTGNSWPNIPKTVNYGSSFSLVADTNSEVTQPKARVGHTAVWAVSINDEWINITNGSKWDETIYEWIPLTVPETSFDLRNKADEIITTITNGTLFNNIKSIIQVQAKYTKNKHNLNFYYGDNFIYEVRNIKYGTEFSLYKLDVGETDPNITYGTKTKQQFVRYNTLEDWDIKWYPSRQYEENEEIKFELEPITVESDKNYYCNDLDLRVYEVEFYDWDFNTNESVLMHIDKVVGEDIVSIWTQNIPHGTDAIPPTPQSKAQFGYDLFENNNFWHDAPQNKGYAKQIYTNGITKNTKFYARYKIRSYSITFRDYYYPYDNNGNADDLTVVKNLPNVIYYKDDFGNDLSTGYLPMEAVYTRDYNYHFDATQIYFGGDDIYRKKSLIEQYEADETLYNSYLSDIVSIKANILRYTGYINEIEEYEAAILSYTTTPEAYERYLQLKPNYDLYRERYYLAKQKLDFVESYKLQYYQPGDNMPTGAEVGDANLDTGAREREYMLLKYERQMTAGEYDIDENGFYIFVSDGMGGYIDNGDYERYCNLFYKNIDRIGFEFDGWFTSQNFNVNARISLNDEDTNEISTKFDVTNNIILYAKWVDLNKGSDGLVFELVKENNPNYGDEGEDEFIFYYQVIDYIIQSQKNEYIEITQNNEKFYEIYEEGSTYLRKTVLKELISFNKLADNKEGMDAEVKIPAFHQGLPVIKITADVFKRNNDKPTAIDLPSSLESISEGTFETCSQLMGITKSDENEAFVIDMGVLYSADMSVLICYPASLVILEYSYMGTDILVPETTFIVPKSVTRIAKGAFRGVNHLKYIAFEPSLTDDELVIGEEAFQYISSILIIGCMTIDEDAGIYIASKYLPDRLTTIEARAFNGALNIENMTTSTESKLIYVGEDILSATKWMNKAPNTTYLNGTSSNGIIMLGYVALGAGSIAENIVFDATQVKSIADSAFSNKSNIITIKIMNPEFQHIGKKAFFECIHLTEVDLYGSDPAMLTVGDLAFGGTGNLTIYVPSDTGVMEAYKEAEGWSQYATRIASRP